MTNHEFKEDTLDRLKIAKTYVDFINTLNHNHTIALDAPWGTGKTTFIKFMCDEFFVNEDVYINYNAWDNDYTNEPFLSLMSEFFTEIKEKKYTKSNDFDDIKKTIYKSSKVLIPAIAKGAANFLVGGKVIDDLEGIGKDIAKSLISDVPISLVNQTFDTLSKSKKSRSDFKIKLKETVKNILKENNKTRLIFIIDELDRCKPTFAIELLEDIKHLFSIDEIVFLIAVDKEQLSESIKAVYGSGFDATTYLHRFFDFELHLPIKRDNTFFAEKLEKVFGINNPNAIDTIHYAVENFDLTLRDFERILTEAYIIKELNNLSLENEYEYKMSLIVLLILKYKHIKAFDILENNLNQSTEDNMRKIGVLDNDNIVNNFFHSHLEFLCTKSTNHQSALRNPLNSLSKICIDQIHATL